MYDRQDSRAGECLSPRARLLGSIVALTLPNSETVGELLLMPPFLTALKLV